MSKILSVIICFLAVCVNVSAQKDYTKYVNPFIGTGGHGHTFPGATVPFGAVQLSPDTRIDNWDGSSGYHYSDNEIFGFSHTHLSGTGIPDYCDILVTPSIDGNNSRTFSHATEKGEAGYYSVKMDNGILAEMTASTRVGVHRYTFNDEKFVNINFNLNWRDKVLDSSVKIVGNNRIEGYRRSQSWAKDQIIYFSAEFSKPFVSSAIANSDEINERNERLKESKGTNLNAMLRFENFKQKSIVVKVGISAVSIENARLNLQTEVPHWNFDKVRADAKAVWNKELSQIEITDDNQDNLTKFYTALYHTKIQPNVFSDVNGDYLGIDKKTHNLRVRSPKSEVLSRKPQSTIRNPQSENYTIFSLWDTFRAAHPLYTIIDEKRTVQFINTFIRQYEQGGRLPVWELAGNETDCMIGYHSVSVIADAMAKGLKGFDYEKAFEASKHSAEMNHFGLEAYKKKGFIEMSDENESVSKTLEYAYDDFCIAMMASILSMNYNNLSLKPKNKENASTLKEDYHKFIKRSRYYENLFDSETGFMRPRQNGGFISPFKPNEVSFHFTEGNSWVYSFFVPHDMEGLIDLQGGKANFAKKLDELFTTKDELTGREQPDITGLIGQYAHGNEPSHHIAYLYNYADQPWKTQKLVRQILDEFYKNDPDGLIGNEDCGQMSAWFILSSLGFYQVVPGREFYDIGTPLFKEAKIHLENGKTFSIKAPSVSDKNIYVKSVKLGGNTYKSTRFSHNDIKDGKSLDFEMSDKPNVNWFTEFSTSRTAERNFIAAPIISIQERVFKKATNVSINSNAKDAKILYSIDGSEPKTEYKQEFTVEKDAKIKAVSVNSKGEKSQIVESIVHKLPHDWSVKLFSKYNRQYTGGGEIGLIDGIRGTTNFASGEWQGYQSQDFIAVIDLQKETEIKKLGGGFLQNARSWIWMPTKIEFEVSNDNVSFTKIAEIKTNVAPEDIKEQIKDFATEIKPTKARFLRVKATNLGKIPAWHPGAGFEAFIFVDEIFIE